MHNPNLEAALFLAARDIRCFPLQPGDKRPLGGSHGCKDATCDSSILKSRFENRPDLNVGAATGRGIVVIDVDNKRGKNGSAAWRSLLPNPPTTLVSKTPNGGEHWWFSTDQDFKNSVDTLGIGIDVRSEGGYVVVPPSIADGAPYEWLTCPKTPIACLPDSITEKLLEPAKQSGPAAQVNSSGLVEEGGRNDYLFRYGCRLRGAGWDHRDILRELSKENSRTCKPHLEKSEVALIAKSVLRYPSNDALTETGNAARFHMQFRDRIRYSIEAKEWLVYENGLWLPDTTKQVVEYMKGIAKDIAVSAAYETGKRREKLGGWAKRSEAASTIRASLDLAKSIERMPVSADQLDSHPMLLSTENGVIDLNSGLLRAHDPSLLLTKRVPVRWSESAECPRWLEFLDQIFMGRQPLIAYAQRLFGYILTGKTSEQTFTIFYGNGRNGKSTLLLVLRRILGDFARHVQPDLFVTGRKHEGPNPSLVRLKGARLVTTTETEENQRLSESFVKQITGSDPVEARGLYADPIEFVPTFKVVLATNHRPKIKGVDDAIWRRIHLVPFDLSIPKKEVIADYDSQLLEEAPGILRWMVEGCLDWQQVGLAPPRVVQAATEQYKHDEDHIGRFLKDAGLTEPDVSRPSLYRLYRDWTSDQGLHAMSAMRLYDRLRLKGYREKRVKGVDYFCGLPTGGVSWEAAQFDVLEAEAP